MLRLWTLFCGLRLASAEVIPGVLEEVVLAPENPYHIKVPVGEAKFLAYSCKGGPADIVISLSTYAERADPLLFLSTNPEASPTFQNHESSSLGQWHEDNAGSHYVVARAVNPKGGILGLVNVRHFAGEELDGILRIHCTFIIAFDALFWDHLRNSAVCPVGTYFEDGRLIQSPNFCSGHGHCNKYAECDCDGDWIGPACEHSKKDIVVAADGHYRFKVAAGKYQYFRIRIPPEFAGGYLEIKVVGQRPLIVLVRSGDFPTKTNYELSNFDQWISNDMMDDLKYKVSPPMMGGMPGAPFLPPVGVLGPPPLLPPLPPPPYMGGMGGAPPELPVVGGPGGGRRLLDSLRSATDVDSWSEFLARAKDFEDGLDDIPEIPARRLFDPTETRPGSWQPKCPDLALNDSPACRTTGFQHCETSCKRCMGCVKGGSNGEGDRGCTDACDACVNPGCIGTLAECAAGHSCTGVDAMNCEAGCGRCMSCFDSNDDKCRGCDCCLRCLPLAAKCSMSQTNPAPYNRFAFVGVYNHPNGSGDHSVVAAMADITLTEDLNYARTELPPSWTAELYDKFHDVRTLEITQAGVYPDGGRFVYEIDAELSDPEMQVRLYRDRLTMLRVTNTGDLRFLELRFVGGPKIDHVLSAAWKAPKTLLDFDQKHETAGGVVNVEVHAPVVWVALFASMDGYTNMSFKMVQRVRQGPAIGFALVCVFGFLCALLVLGVIYGGAQKLGDLLGMDPNMPLMERLGCLVRNVKPHESTASLTRTGSLTGYIGSDGI
mmetsp:Transcript_73747/g.207080  ORF Transcript_73747/g.207080 Transcript_73747/m.207080 type:complete len:772 (-) Transcript_73747:21-2336(-)